MPPIAKQPGRIRAWPRLHLLFHPLASCYNCAPGILPKRETIRCVNPSYNRYVRVLTSIKTGGISMNRWYRSGLRSYVRLCALWGCAVLVAGSAWAQRGRGNLGNSEDDGGNNSCTGMPSYADLKKALDTATSTEKSGLNNQMWATVVDRDGVVCAVAFSGNDRGAQWPGSRVISAQKANTANAFSLDNSSNSNGSGQPAGLALSTANLYSAVQPGGSLFGLQASNPVDTGVAYKGPSIHYGTANDPMVGSKIGGVNVFGG